MNSFSLGAQVGGQTSNAASRQEQALRDIFNRWAGEYSGQIREFAFILRVDGNIYTYTEMWGILGAQKAKRKRDRIEVEIGIPQSWWGEAIAGDAYKRRLVDEVERGLNSMIDVLRAKKIEIKAELLLEDWGQRRAEYLAVSVPERGVARA
jgi:hypothetical protein